MNIRQHKFVTEYLRFGNQAIAYKNAYNSKATGKVIESAANRLMKNPEVTQAITGAQAAIREQVEKEVAAQLKAELLSVQRKRELLYQIATGEMQVLQYHKGKDCNSCSQYVTPSINHMLRAIHLDNKLAGHYPLHNHSPLGRGVGVGPLAQEKQNTKSHNKTQQINSSLEGGARQTSGGGCTPTQEQKQQNHNIPIAIGTQQYHSSFEGGAPQPSGGGCPHAQETPNTITSEELNDLLNTKINHEATPRILQFRRKETLVE